MHTLDLEQQRYDSMLPPDNSFMEDAVEEQVAIIIDRQGLDWLEQHVSTETWGNIVTALEEVAKAEIAEEIEDAQWEWRNRQKSPCEVWQGLENPYPSRRQSH